MSPSAEQFTGKVALVTGSAKRLGAAIVRALHDEGANVVVHCNQSIDPAHALVDELNRIRDNSATLVRTELGTKEQAMHCVKTAVNQWKRLDILINNASSFFPTAMGNIDDEAVSNLFSSNVTAPLFLTQAAQPELERQQGAIVNMADIHGIQPHPNHVVYSSAKAALIMMTRSLAHELAPTIRVNAIAPGAILWAENDLEDQDKQKAIVSEIPLGRRGSAEDIANLVVYLCSDSANFITGEIIRVDGGRAT